jgi:hypothetical protein
LENAHLPISALLSAAPRRRGIMPEGQYLIIFYRRREKRREEKFHLVPSVLSFISGWLCV